MPSMIIDVPEGLTEGEYGAYLYVDEDQVMHIVADRDIDPERSSYQVIVGDPS